MFSVCRREFVASFHTSSYVSKGAWNTPSRNAAGPSNPPRNRSKRPRFGLKESTVRVRRPDFQRDELPHSQSAAQVEQEEKAKSVSFRRRTQESSKRDWKWRTRELATRGWASEIAELKRQQLRTDTQRFGLPGQFVRSFSTSSSLCSGHSAAYKKVQPPSIYDRQTETISFRPKRRPTFERPKRAGPPRSKPFIVKPPTRKQPPPSQPSSPSTPTVKKVFPGFGFLNSESLQPSPATAVTQTDAPKRVRNFAVPPLTAPYLCSVVNLLGSQATPTEIQCLALGTMFSTAKQHNQYLISSETGSGKTMAYLLPVLQSLKRTDGTALAGTQPLHLQPRAIILTPTHELSRQTAMFAKALCASPGANLRVQCISANFQVMKWKFRPQEQDMTPSKMKAMVDACSSDVSSPELSVTPKAMGEAAVKQNTELDRTYPGYPHAVDVVVGTPMKVMELVKGRGWNRAPQADGDGGRMQVRMGRELRLHDEGLGEKYMGLENVEWVIIDEADTLFDPDFQQVTRLILSEISRARGVETPVPQGLYDPSDTPAPPPQIPDYPFSLVLSTATLPSYLLSYLSTHHPDMRYLISKGVHQFPAGLDVEYSTWRRGGGVGGKLADIERRIRQVWQNDLTNHVRNVPPRSGNQHSQPDLSKILIFLNKSTSVDQLSAHLSSKGIQNIGLTSKSEHRQRGSNRIKSLPGFLNVIPRPAVSSGPENEADSTGDEAVGHAQNSAKPTVRTLSPLTAVEPEAREVMDDEPRVLITTSLLSRGLDFSPSIKHVFIVDEPRNYIDVLHRAGRVARAGNKGKVVFFGDFGDKLRNLRGALNSQGKPRRESERGKEIRKRIEELRR